MRKADFEELVRDAVEQLPDDFLAIMSNVDVQVRRWPTRRQLRHATLDEGETLLGLYEGVPVTDRGGNYNMVLPDIITVFQGPIEGMCSTTEEIVKEVRETITHEVAHYFGISDAELEEWGVA